MPDALAPILQFLGPDPAIGLSVVDETGLIRHANRRAKELFVNDPDATVRGQRLEDVYGKAWADERLAIFQKIKRTDKPAILRHIRHGRQLQSTIRPIDIQDDHPTTTPATTPHDAPECFIVFTIEGQYDPPSEDHFEIIESNLAHLGPLESLTRRELEVLALIGHGLSAREIAQALYRSHRTIESHVERIKQKLGDATRHQLATFARRAHLTLHDTKLKRID